MDQMTELELQGLLDRDRIVALMNRYFATIDDATTLDTEWTRSIFSDDVRVEHRGFTLQGIEDLAVGNRFVREAGTAPSTSAPTLRSSSTAIAPTSGLSY